MDISSSSTTGSQAKPRRPARSGSSPRLATCEPATSRKRLGDLLLEPLKTGISKPSVRGASKRCVTLSSVRDGYLDPSASKPAAVSDAEAEGNWVRPDAFYVVRGNGQRSLVGRGAFARSVVDPPVLYPDLLIQVIVDQELIRRRYLRYVWDGHDVRMDIERRARTSAGIFKINQRNLLDVTIRLPSTEEQTCVVGILDGILARATRLWKAAEDQLATINALPGALLERAFGREL